MHTTIKFAAGSIIWSIIQETYGHGPYQKCQSDVKYLHVH